MSSRSGRRLSLQIQVDADAGPLPADRRQLRRWVTAALSSDADLVLRFVGNAEGRELNRQFRGRDKATNVLTFDYEREPLVRADIVICLPVLRAEAAAQSKSERDHLAHLVVEGAVVAVAVVIFMPVSLASCRPPRCPAPQGNRQGGLPAGSAP